MEEDFSPELLREKRKAAGMTLQHLATLSQLHYSTISDYEKGRRNPTAAIWKKLLQGLSGEPVPVAPSRYTWRKVEPLTPSQPQFIFDVGHVYSIRDHNFGGAHADGINPQYGTLCEFRYEGKRGIHHCFREARGGWTRTYTDTQLIGKKIEEAVECPTKQ